MALVPLVVLLLWIAAHRRAEAARFAVGAAGAMAIVCLPFLAAAPSRMFRMLVLDQAGRGNNGVGLPRRLAEITAARQLSSAIADQFSAGR